MPANLDICPSCRIQAPHREGRTICPRCGGPLTQSAPSRRPPPPPRRPALRWTAHRPREAMPAPRGPRRPEKGPTPSYAYNPGWGLLDVPEKVVEVDSRVPAATAALTRAMELTCLILGAAAVVHGARYVIAVVNRTRPIPAWIDWLSSIAVLVFGVMSLIAVVVAIVSFGRWVREIRVRSFAAATFLDPRPAWVVFGLTVTPLVNVIGAPWMLHEAARVTDADDGRLMRIRLRLAVAWALVNGVAVLALIYRVGAWSTNSLQVDADALALVTASFAVSAVFARWAVTRIERLAGSHSDVEERPLRRLVAA
ncbi:DUF4328 domain-containing protein [Gordonia sp. PDNC005]|uniref:DUF4328 domain-containing protein n=1 Tax=Gordonia sp. PDNC005 TaxID=2811424 RepID=UPI001962B1F0|nr:DUF4328 domain-containing protein [Gordonia sp. PDNC005]QRY62453.1 DUF4328 domain-containing protein [Gordonia sp. PDNC005]